MSTSGSDKRIMIADEKHGERYFDASTDELLYASALKLLRERFEDEYWYTPVEELEMIVEEKEAKLLTEEQIADLPTDELRVHARKSQKKLVARIKQLERELREAREITQALDKSDGELAWRCLRSRADHEYEYVYLDYLE